MFRLVYRFIIFLFFFAVLRYVVTTVARVYSQMSRSQNPPPAPQPPKAEIGGELKQDPVCGTFVPAASSLNKNINGELVYFCSAACRDKFKVA